MLLLAFDNLQNTGGNLVNEFLNSILCESINFHYPLFGSKLVKFDYKCNYN